MKCGGEGWAASASDAAVGCHVMGSSEGAALSAASAPMYVVTATTSQVAVKELLDLTADVAELLDLTDLT